MEKATGNKLIGVSCAAHILNNCIQTGSECSPLDIEVVVVKIYSYFYIYTVRLEQFKEICDVVDVEYHKILGYSKTRWLTLKPALERILKLFEPLKTYFLAQKKCPLVIKKMLLYMERQGKVNSGSFKEAAKTFYATCVEYLEQWNSAFKEIEVLEWTLLKNVPSWDKVEQLLVFILAIRANIIINDAELFDEVSLVQNFATVEKIEEWKNNKISVDQCWVEIFTNFDQKNIKLSNILKVVEFSLCLPASNAPTERVF